MVDITECPAGFRLWYCGRTRVVKCLECRFQIFAGSKLRAIPTEKQILINEHKAAHNEEGGHG